jgi:hypothetical protein
MKTAGNEQRAASIQWSTTELGHVEIAYPHLPRVLQSRLGGDAQATPRDGRLKALLVVDFNKATGFSDAQYDLDPRDRHCLDKRLRGPVSGP